MKLHSFRQDLQDYFVLVCGYILSILLILSENCIFMPLSFLLRFDRPFFWPAAGLTPLKYQCTRKQIADTAPRSA